LADDVFVLISNPKSEKSKRRIGDREVKLAHSGDLWRSLTQGMEGVQIFDPEDAPPSPLTAVTKVISDPVIAEKYGTIYLGASEKGGDDKRFNYILKHAHPDIEIVNEPAPVTSLPGEYKAALEETGYLEKMPSTAKGKDPQNYHASDLRFLLQNACGDEAARRLAEFYVGPGNVDLYLTTCEVAGGNQVEITESQLLEIIKEELDLVLQEEMSNSGKSLPGAIAKVSALLDPFLDAKVMHNDDGTEEYEQEQVTEQAIEALSQAIDIIQDAFLSMMAGEPIQEEEEKKKCPRCGTVNDASNDKCSNCGLPMGEEWEGKSWESVQ